jgi:glycerol kinase
VLALDQGTTSSRAILFDAQGRPVASASRPFPQHYPRDGWVEHDPEDLWTTTLESAREALQRAGADAASVAAIGVTNQRETALAWDRASGQALAPAIVWQCRRTADLCATLRDEGWSDQVRARTGLVIDPYFSATKWAWLLENVPGLRERAQRGEVAFGTVDSFLLWRLSGGRLHITDASNAARTMLFDIHRQVWDDALLRRLDIPASALPEVVDSSGAYGESDPALFGRPIPLASAVGDQQAATFGQACFEPGAAKNTYGTGAFLLMNTGDTAIASRHNLLTTVAWRIGGDVTYALEGSIFIAGAAVQWLRDGLKLIDSAPEVERLAAGIGDSGGVYVVPAFVGLGAPYWDAGARGLICGLTRDTTDAHIARATLESMCYQTRDVLGCMEADSGRRLSALRVDGGAVVNNLLMQLQADILGIPVQRSAVAETTALGAAYLAGLAVGVWSNTEELAASWSSDRSFEPQLDRATRDARYDGWKRAVARAGSRS